MGWNAGVDYIQQNGWYRPKPAGGGGAAAFTPGASVPFQAIAFSAGTKTFTGLNGGTNFPAGALVLVGVVEDQTAVTLTTPLIGGVAATLVKQDTSTRVSLYQAVMSSSSADTFSFANGNAVGFMGVAAGYFQNLVSTTADATGTEVYGNQGDPQNLPAAITVNAGGFGVAVVGKASGGANPTALTWTSTTSASGDVFSKDASTGTIGLAHTATAGSWNPGASGVTNSMGFCSALVAATYH